MPESKEKMSCDQIALYAQKYLKMRNHSVERFLDCDITTPEGIRQYDLRNDELLRKWQYEIQKESDILFFEGMHEDALNCLRYLAMREEGCWHIARKQHTTNKGVKIGKLSLNSPEEVKKSKDDFDALAENHSFYHISSSV